MRSVALFFLLVLSACSGNVSETKHADTTSFKKTQKTVVDFLKWYRDNFDTVNSYTTVNNLPPSDSTKYYSVNFEETNKYLLAFKKSGFVSNQYLETWRRYFETCNENFNKIHQNDGPPEGFEYDFVTLSQESRDVLADLDHVKILHADSITDTSKAANVDIELYGYRYEYTLIKEQNVWLINEIVNTTGDRDWHY
jgi:hypothetical protein